MKTMAQIDAWFETEMNKAKLEGEARGEERRNQAIALKMLRKDIPLETIAEVTGLTIEYLEQLSLSPTE
jgi:predicted transposase/invertase (TIGR01784 family)